MTGVTALVGAEPGWLAMYGWADDESPDGLGVRALRVVGWGAVGGELRAVAVFPDMDNSVGVLVGSAQDPWGENFLAITAPGEDWERYPGADRRVRAVLRMGLDVEVNDAV